MKKYKFLAMSILLLLFTLIPTPANSYSVGETLRYNTITSALIIVNGTQITSSQSNTTFMINITQIDLLHQMIYYDYIGQETAGYPIIGNTSFNVSESYLYLTYSISDSNNNGFYEVNTLQMYSYGFICPNMTKNVEELNKTIDYITSNYPRAEVTEKEYILSNYTFIIKLKMPVERNLELPSGEKVFRGNASFILKAILRTDAVVKLLYSERIENLTATTGEGTVYIRQINSIKLYEPIPPSNEETQPPTNNTSAENNTSPESSEQTASNRDILSNILQLAFTQNIAILTGTFLIALVIGIVTGKKIAH